VDLNVNIALVLVVGFFGFVMMTVSGGIVSTVHVFAFAGDLSMFPARSIARTWKICFPSIKGSEVHGLVHEANTLLSKLHSKVLLPSVEVKEKVARGLFVYVGGLAVIMVFGAFVSTVQS
jgi:hypothetical protein